MRDAHFFYLMPSSFQGNKSFIAFSNLGDTDSLTKTWKVCTKVAGYLEQGQRLENLSWRLWHLQNLMVDTDNAKSKREFKKLSKNMGDKLDKEKGRSIEELEAPGFRRNHSTDIIRQRAAEKERTREANQYTRPGTIKRMQFTFSVDQPQSTASALTVDKPDFKPSAEFKDTINRRGRPTTRAAAAAAAESATDATPSHPNGAKDPPLTQRGRKPAATTHAPHDVPSHDPISDFASLRFPSLFSSDFAPAALLHASPSLTNGMSYGEGVRGNANSLENFGIVRPTIELPLDELLIESSDSPGDWSFSSSFDRQQELVDTPQPSSSADQDVDMKPIEEFPTHALSRRYSRSSAADSPQPTVAPSKLGSGGATPSSSSSRPTLSVRTNASGSRSSGPSATAANPPAPNPNTAPGGVKAECSNCGATHTPLWRRGLNDELNCNACGLYCKLHKRPRPKTMRSTHGEGRSQAAPRQEAAEQVIPMAQCYNCHTTATPLWRKDEEGKTVCNALSNANLPFHLGRTDAVSTDHASRPSASSFKLHGSARPISMKSDVIRKRSCHDARRVGNASETPSASPGASRRPSPNGGDASPMLAPDSTTMSFDQGGDAFDYRTSNQSELMGALGTEQSQQNAFQDSYPSLMFPGPYHPDYLSQMFNQAVEAHTFPSDNSDADSTSDTRSTKRRRLSSSSATDPPSSAVSYSSFGDFSSSSGTSASASSGSQRNAAGNNSSSNNNNSSTGGLEYPFGGYSPQFGMLRGGGGNNGAPFWHPPMLPPTHSPHFIHPPMLPQTTEESPMDFLHPPMLPSDDGDALFSAYLHPPMMLPEEGMGLQPHPPMFPSDWNNGGGNQSGGGGGSF
ncbi:hypothetical protein OF83DRAFT_1080557 [Amylostereum chailletii]|nr:hypothetical protein OF83DRAFT_1080557 [Amylostereum chailletii]